MDFGNWYLKGNEITFLYYSDTDWEGCVDDRRITTGTPFFLCNFLVSWSCKKQYLMCLSTIEAEYIAATICHSHIFLMKKNLQ